MNRSLEISPDKRYVIPPNLVSYFATYRNRLGFRHPEREPYGED